jgi:predicted ester cyclase
MATDNKVVVRRIFDEIFNQKNADAIDELFDENFVDHGPGRGLHGREELRSVFTRWLSAVPDVQIEVSHLIQEGDTVGWVARATGTHVGDAFGLPATGKRVELITTHIGVVRNGTMVERWWGIVSSDPVTSPA